MNWSRDLSEASVNWQADGSGYVISNSLSSSLSNNVSTSLKLLFFQTKLIRTPVSHRRGPETCTLSVVSAGMTTAIAMLRYLGYSNK
jgi:hypothetical protein